ncbi:MFS transporter [Tepidiphilus thermophilus]|uniref:Major Facilitator Superfamily n=1 Tax=Tepidiphilus thermophilus TaxID=876478 RepID=A0A0K6IXD8_9PROT|nr:MFS transporter [Tepidiphilus thermophilus]CUB07997.1 Major Facilitator Superfamily [Tepidiphilus thermophilus]
MPLSDPAPRGGLRALPLSVWGLALTSLFMDISSEMIHSLLPLFLSGVLGASMATIGLIEGLAEATVAFTKVFSGALSDFLHRRKAIVVTGYALSAFTKPLFPLAASVSWVLAARLLDRFGKGIREAPRDALIADVTPDELRGAAYGLRQALDSVGAFVGPLLAFALMAWFAGDIRLVFWVAALPAILAVLALVRLVPEPPRVTAPAVRETFSWRQVLSLPRAYWAIVGLGVLFTLARYSEAFLLLRAHDVGLATEAVPLVMIAMNVAYAALAYPAGAAADRIGPQRLLLAGIAALVLADLLLAAASGPTAVFLAAVLWGLHLAATQGIFAKMIAHAAQAELRGTAFGLFHLLSGLALLAASSLAGWLWSVWSAEAAFLAAALLAAIAAAALTRYEKTP